MTPTSDTEGARGRHLPELLSALYALGFGFFLFSDNGMRVDEIAHFDQIIRLAIGPVSLNPLLTTLPGFHALVAPFVWLTGGSEFAARLATLLLSVATVFTFYGLARELHPAGAGTKLLQFTFLPILFPQFFLVYTDVPAMLFVLLMMLAAVKRRYHAAGVLGFVSCLMRQNDLIWMAFVLLWSYRRDNGWTWIPVRQFVARYWTFIATALAMLAFVAANDGQIALGDAKAHPLGSLHLTNVFFLLFVAFFLFLPLWWGYRRELAARLRSRWTWLGLVVLFPVFWLGFVNSHPYNQSGGDFYIRNALLIYFTSTAARKLLLFVPVALSTLFFATAPLKKPWWLLYAFTVLALLPEWLVEQRYYLIPLSLFLLAREPADRWSERAQTALFIAGSAALFLMVERSWRWM